MEGLSTQHSLLWEDTRHDTLIWHPDKHGKFIMTSTCGELGAKHPKVPWGKASWDITLHLRISTLAWKIINKVLPTDHISLLTLFARERIYNTPNLASLFREKYMAIPS